MTRDIILDLDDNRLIKCKGYLEKGKFISVLSINHHYIGIFGRNEIYTLKN